MKISQSRAAGFTLLEIMIVVAIIRLLASIAVPNFVKNSQPAQKIAFLNTLRQIEDARQLWALETKAASTTIPGTTDIQPYVGRGRGGTALVCPAGFGSTVHEQLRSGRSFCRATLFDCGGNTLVAVKANPHFQLSAGELISSCHAGNLGRIK